MADLAHGAFESVADTNRASVAAASRLRVKSGNIGISGEVQGRLAGGFGGKAPSSATTACPLDVYSDFAVSDRHLTSESIPEFATGDGGFEVSARSAAVSGCGPTRDLVFYMHSRRPGSARGSRIEPIERNDTRGTSRCETAGSVLDLPISHRVSHPRRAPEPRTVSEGVRHAGYSQGERSTDAMSASYSERVPPPPGLPTPPCISSCATGVSGPNFPHAAPTAGSASQFFLDAEIGGVVSPTIRFSGDESFAQSCSSGLSRAYDVGCR